MTKRNRMPDDDHDVPAITTDQMREVDRLMVEAYGIELLQMMENAGRHLAHLARRRASRSLPPGRHCAGVDLCARRRPPGEAGVDGAGREHDVRAVRSSTRPGAGDAARKGIRHPPRPPCPNPGRRLADGRVGDDPSLRPNQIFAASLPHSPLSTAQQEAVVDTCAAHLYTPQGLRSLAPAHPDYVGVYRGDRKQRDGAYHQGTVWSWLIGPFVKAHLRMYDDPPTARSYLAPLRRHLEGHGVGSVSEIFDGDAPFTPRGTPAQAWGVAQLIEAWTATQHTPSA